MSITRRKHIGNKFGFNLIRPIWICDIDNAIQKWKDGYVFDEETSMFQIRDNLDDEHKQH